MGLLPMSKPTGDAAPAAASEGQPDPSKYVADGEPNVTPEEQAEYDQFMHNAAELIYRDGQDGGEVRPEVLQILKAGADKGGPPPAPGAPPAPPADPNQPAPPAAPVDPSQPAPPPSAPPASPDKGLLAPTDQAPAPNAPPSDPADAAKRPAIMALSQATVSIVGQLDDSARQAGKPISDDVLMHGGKDVLEELATVAETAKIYSYTQEDLTGAYAQAVDMYRPKAIQDGRTSQETLKGQFQEVNDAEAAGKLGDVLPGLGSKTVNEPPVKAQGA